MHEAVQAIHDYQLLGGNLSAYKLEELDCMEYYRYALFQACKSADIAAQNRTAGESGKSMSGITDYVKFEIDPEEGQ